MPKRPVAEALARANSEPLEVIPDFPAPNHAALCALLTIPGSDCDCGIADAIAVGPDALYDFATAKPEFCGATSPWLTHCTSEVEHNGSHSWQDQDRFPPLANEVTGGSPSYARTALEPLKDAEEVFAPAPAIREVNGKWTAIELAGTPAKQPKGNAPMTSTAATVSMSATLMRLGYKSGTQADPDAYVEMVIRTNDLSVGAELGWQTGKTLTVTMQPEQPRLAIGSDEQD